MSKARILVVEDDSDISNLLTIYFTGQGYDVHAASSGCDAISLAQQLVPNLIMLDIMLPDLDGFAVCTELRAQARTCHIPIIFLTHRVGRSDRITGLELGAEDFVTKPFDIEELKLRAQNAIYRNQRERLTDAWTGLPSGRLIEERLRRDTRKDGWALMDLHINHFEPYRERYGFVASERVLRFTAKLMNRLLAESDRRQDFAGHSGGGDFVIITTEEAAPVLGDRLKQTFAVESRRFYSNADRERGHIMIPAFHDTSERVPLMTLAIGIATSNMDQFADIRQITAFAAEARRRDAYSEIALDITPIRQRIPG
ncbi:MAG: response regulator [Anaerolineales bacterium]|jgi:DNA-binding response OmpR family regulator